MTTSLRTKARAAASAVAVAVALAGSTAPSPASAGLRSGPHGWTTSGPWGGDAGPLVVDPADRRRVLVAGFGGIFRSVDGGRTWNQDGIGVPMNHTPVRALAASPSEPGVLYAQTDRGAFRGTSDGAVWTKTTSLDFNGHASLAVDPVHPGVLYAGSGGAVMRSSDGGVTWNILFGDRFCEDDFCDEVDAVAVDPAHPSTVLAFTEQYGLVVSRDAGATWQSARRPYDTGARFLVFDPANASTVYALGDGVWRSRDDGRSWARLPGEVRSPSALGIDPADPNHLVLGTDAASLLGPDPSILESDDAGATWTPAGAGLGVPSVGDVAFVGGTGRGLLASTENGLYRRDDGGSRWIWSSRGFGGLDLQNVEAGAGAVLAGTWGNGVFRRTSRGWIRSNTGLLGGAIDGPFGFMDEIDAGPGSAVVYTKELNDGFYRSGDRGRTWTLIQRGPDAPSYVAIVPGTPNHVFTTDDYLGVQESTDGGRHWTARNAGLPTRDGYVFAGRVTLDLTDPERLYLGMEHDVYASSNGGTSWVASGPGIPHRLWYPRPVVDPMAPRTLFVLTDHVLYRSTDRGRTWSPLSGAPDHVTHLAFDASGVVYAVNGSRRGVFASTDGGVTWQTVHGGLPGPALDVTVSSGPPEETLFVATPTGVSELPIRLR